MFDVANDDARRRARIEDSRSLIEQLFESRLIVKREFDAACHVLNLYEILTHGRSLAASETMKVLKRDAKRAEPITGWDLIMKALKPADDDDIHDFLNSAEVQKRLRNVLQRLATAADCMMTELTRSQGTA